MVLYRDKNVAASLEYVDEPGGGYNVFSPVVSLVQRYFGIQTDEEKTWQSEVRHYDLNNVGILGNSLDLIGFTASTAQFQYVDPMTLQPTPNPILQKQLLNPIWRDGQHLDDIVNKGVRSLAQVGELDLVKIEGKYDLFQVSQRVKDTDNEFYPKINKNDVNEPLRLKKWGTVTYRQRADGSSKDTVVVSREHIQRCFVQEPGANHEAYAPGRRVLPWLRLYTQITRQLQNIAFSNSLMTKGIWAGPDNGDWERDEEYTTQFGDPSKAVPPVINDLVKHAQGLADGKRIDPFWPMMSDIAPEVLDLTTSFDEMALKAIEVCNKEIALGLNFPAKRLLADDVTHFTKWAEDQEFQEITVGPLLKTLLKFLDRHVYSAYPAQDGYAAKLWYSFDNLGANALNPAQLIELFKIRGIGSKGIQRILKLTNVDTYISPEDDRVRRELLTGDSGLQQEQLAQRDAQKQGQQAQAVPDSTPVTNGNMRQGSEKQVAAALDSKKKES